MPLNLYSRQVFSRSRQALCLLSLFCLMASCAKEVESDDDLLGNWKRSFEFEGVSRTEAVSFTIGDVVYVGGGTDGKKNLQDFWRYDYTMGTWIRIADFPGTARSSAVGFAIDGKGYVGTGYDDNDDYLKDFWSYDPRTDSWTRKADFGGTARFEAVGFAIDKLGFVCAGYDGNFLKDLWAYDPATDSWTQKSSLGGSKRSGASVFVYNKQAYVVAGVNNGSYLNDFWVYNAESNSWTEKRKISDATDEDYDDEYDDYIKRSNGATFIRGTKGYLLCGNRSGVIGSVWEYDFASDLWAEKTFFEGTPREGCVAFTVSNKLFMTMGNNSSVRFDDMWEFDPDAEQDDDDN